ncbi:MAG: hypothetical protein LBI82_08700 [Dysgonamonadaceae bacterium]|jgi:hypothetical protein|nr:hypothetical protein [Dysgonamonadaceae bacterium]
MKKATILLSLAVFLTVSCTKRELVSQVSNVNFTPCQQSKLRSTEPSDKKVDVEFTNEGVRITYYNFEVTCDFSNVDVTHTFVNGFLNITQKSSPNQADCICYSDVSYTIDGISKNEVNVIFINGVQVYCYNDNGNDEDDESTGNRNVDALNKFVQDNQYSFRLGYIFNEYANKDLIISYKPYNGYSTLRGFAIIRNGVVYNTTFTIPRAGDNGAECIWNGNYVTVAIVESGNDESTGLYGFQINNENLSKPAVKLWQNTDYGLRHLQIYPFSEKVNGNYYFGGERNNTYRSSFRCNMVTGETLFTDNAQVNRAFAPIIYVNGNYYGACCVGDAGDEKFCIASSQQYYNNTNFNTQQLSEPNLTAWSPSVSFDFGKRRGVVTAKVNGLRYPVSLSSAEIDMSVPALPNVHVFKYKNKSYMMQNEFKQLVEIGDISYIFDDKYVALPK